jgi:uncharacterized protein (DUF1501 family)
MKRRLFLKGSGLAAFGVGASPVWLERALYAADAPRPRKKVLVAIFQRGAMDGLSAVVPFGESRYYDLRPSLAVARPNGTEDAALDLDGFFGLHPAMQPLAPLYRAGQLAIVHAAGSPDPTRSHFDAQDYMESGTPGVKSTGDGWLNRTLAKQPASPVRAVALGTALPRALRGRNEAIAIANLNEFEVRDQRGAATFEEMYAATLDKAFGATARDAFDAVKIVQSIREQNREPAHGAQYPNGRFGDSLRQIARLIKANAGLEVAFTDIGGWDTHVNQFAARPSQGQLANLLGQFAQGIAAFVQDLGDRLQDVAIVTMSEFGRTAKENGNRGTDHGHANAMFVLGGGVKGGKVHGDWPGLAPEQLYEGRDLAVTTDFRDVLGELVAKQLGNRNLAGVFPGYPPKFRNVLG